MKKLSLLFTLLCVSVMGFAIDWSGYEYLGDGAGGGAYSNKYKLAPDGDQGVVNIQHPGFATADGIYTTFTGAVTACDLGAGNYDAQGGGLILHLSAFTAKETVVNVTTDAGGGKNYTFTVYYEDGIEGGDALTDPELNLNSTAKTLEASTSETFQIVATQSGDGAVSYESSNAGVASVSNSGLVTAVGRGTATITVRTAETATYAAGSKTLAVTVTGPINWEAVSWLQNSDKYKLVVDPEISNQFGGIRKEGDNLWVGFPSAAFGAMSIEANGGEGAYRTFALSNFTQQINQFTVVCNNVTYTFDVYYADGEPADLTGFNLAKGKTSVSGHDVNNTDQTHIAANDGDKNSRWSSDGGIHYPVAGAQDWWYVDLGGFYRVDQIKILFETAAPTDYDLLISNNAVSWTVLGTYTGQPTTGNAADKYNVYNFTDKVGRYVKIFARNGYLDLAYGISMYEFEVYGDRASISDVNPPVMGTASLSGTPSYDRVNIAVAGTDEEDGAVVQFHVVDATHGVDQSQTAEAGVITVTGLNAETSYTFTITALDAAGNESANSVNVAATTTVDTSFPSVNAPTPPSRTEGASGDVRPLYSDAYTSILQHSFALQNWGSSDGTEREISGNHYLLYNMATKELVVWGENNAGANAIVAAEGYNAGGDGDNTGIDASSMEFLHMDIWSQEAMSNILIRINDQELRRISHNGEGWQQYDIALAEPLEAVISSSVRWMKIEGLTATGKIAFDNMYFWKTPAGLQVVSATANNATYGTASVVVTETGLAPEGGTVADGTEVTFSAVANDGYVFVDWSNGNTNATFNATVDASMNLTANFRALGTTYCNTEMTVNDHTIYLTVKRSDVNEYTMIVRSAEELTNFGGTVFYRPENISVKDIRNEGVLSDGNHTLTVTMDSEGEPYFGTPLYVVFAGVGEVTYNQLLNVRPEYAVACDDAVSVTSIALSQNSANLLVGRTLTLTPTFTPAYATDRALTWETSNASVATVVDGVVTAQAAGTATITARLTSDNTVYATCAITVVDALTETIWHGYIIANPATEKNVLINYSVTRDVEQHLTFSLTTDKNMSGFVAFINIGGVAHELTGYDPGLTDFTATYTTTDTYEDNIPLNCTWDVRGANYGEDFNFTYRVGSENEAQKTLALSETQDNTAALTTLNDQEVAVAIVNRSFAADNLYTLVLPFDADAAMTAEKLPGQLTKLSNTIVKDNGDLRINFVDAEAIEAGVPYLYSPSADVTNPVFTGVTVSKDLQPTEPTDGYAKYYGIYAPMNGTALHDIEDGYVLGGDRYLYAISALPADQTMNALRGYFVLNFNEVPGAPKPRAKVIFNSREEDSPTGIGEVQGEEQQTTKVLRDGQLLIIRDGRTYNAQGQLIY